MATHDYVIDNSTGANVRVDINSVLQAILTNNSNSSAPSTTAAYMLWADTTDNIVKIRNSANNGWINLFTTAGGIDVDAASNFNEDVTFTGASYNVVWDKSDNALEFADNAKAIFGTGSDLEIYHDGSNSYLKAISGGTGNLYIFADSKTIFLRPKSGNDGVKIIPDGAVELYNDNSKKFETVSAGVDVTGNLTFAGDSNTHISHPQADYLKITTGGNEVMSFTNASNIFVPDSRKLMFGDNVDLQIYHDGSNSYLKDAGTGALVLLTSTFALKNAADDANIISGFESGAVELYNNGNKKLETTGSGITVTGTVTETSDIALKSNIEPLNNALEKIKQITGYKYNLNTQASMGVIAQDVEKVLPELVHGFEGKKSLQYSGLIGVLVEAVKELSAKVAALEAA